MPVNTRTDDTYPPGKPRQDRDPTHRPDVGQDDSPPDRGEDQKSGKPADSGGARRARTRKARSKM
jgi:hypothetical protein